MARQELIALITTSESWQNRRVVDYALERDYSNNTAILNDSWRISIVISAITAAKHPERGPVSKLFPKTNLGK
jgi:hypothetical protein